MKIIFKDEVVRIPKNVTKEQIYKLNKMTKMNIEITNPDKYKNVKNDERLVKIFYKVIICLKQ